MTSHLALFTELNDFVSTLSDMARGVDAFPDGERRTFSLWGESIPVVVCQPTDRFGHEWAERDKQPADDGDLAISFYALWCITTQLYDFLSDPEEDDVAPQRNITFLVSEFPHRRNRMLGRLLQVLSERIEAESGEFKLLCSEEAGLLTWSLLSSTVPNVEGCCPTCHRPFADGEN
jgi:hypothetical protein